MTFLFPLGFLVLIGIPIIILVYIIKNRYTEQTIASTYIWNLSEKFLKRRVRVSKLADVFSLILQLAVVALIALAASHPVLTVKNSASEYCFVLDASGSMNMTYSERSRFEEGKSRIEKLIDKAKDGSTYTLILAGCATDKIFEDVADKDRAIELLGKAECSFETGLFEDASRIATEYGREHSAALVYLVTDKTVDKTENVNVVSVYSPVENYAVADVSYDMSYADENNAAAISVNVRGNVISYESDKTLTLEFYLDGAAEAVETLALDAKRGKKTPFSIKQPVENFSSFKVAVKDADALMLDNEVNVYNVDAENQADIMLVSDTPFFVEAAIRSAGSSRIEKVAAKDYVPVSGYGIYIFESFLPQKLPEDGAVWILDPRGSITGANFGFQCEVTSKNKATYSTSTSSVVRSVLKGVTKTEFELYKFAQCKIPRDFFPIITCDGSPLLFVGTNAYGNREVVFAFDVKDSAPFVLHADYETLIANLIKYSLPSVIDSTSYVAGDTIRINKTVGCDYVRVKTPSGKSDYPDTVSSTIEYKLSEAGDYKIELIMKNKTQRTFDVFVALPVEESAPRAAEHAFIVSGITGEKKDGIFDKLIIVFIILAVVAAADYGVYCYEQYQLR